MGLVMWYNKIMKKVFLTNGGFTLVDDEDYEFISQWRWQNSGGYATRTVYLRNENYGKGKNKSINKLVRLHRVINKTPEGLYTDHMNGNKLDNRRANLRNCNYSQNLINKPLKKGGVQFRKDRKRSPWRVYLSHDKKQIYIGCFKTLEDAKSARYAANIQLNKEFAYES